MGLGLHMASLAFIASIAVLKLDVVIRLSVDHVRDSETIDQTVRMSNGRAQSSLWQIGVSITATRSLGDMKDKYIL